VEITLSGGVEAIALDMLSSRRHGCGDYRDDQFERFVRILQLMLTGLVRAGVSCWEQALTPGTRRWGTWVTLFYGNVYSP